MKEGDGPRVFNYNILENSVFGVTYSAMTGLPFTYVTTFDVSGITNNRRYPLESNFDFNFIREFKFQGSNKILFGVRVMNVFNNKWLTPLSADDLNYWVEKGITMDNPADKSETQLKSYRIAAFKTYRNIPRQVFFTLGIGF